MLFNPIKDQTIDGLEEWLKNNKPTVIPRGASTATGYTPPAPSERTQQESKQRAQEINKMIRAENAAKKAEAKANYKAQKVVADKKTKREVVEAIKQFKTKARGGDFGRLAEAVGVARKTLSNWACGDSVPNDLNKMHLLRAISNFNYSFLPKPTPTKPAKRGRPLSAEVARKRELSTRKREALELGNTEFNGPCAKHGMTTYTIANGSARCVLCRKAQQKNKYMKASVNLKLMRESLAKGEKSFTGTCEVHGEAKFFINRSGQYHIYRCEGCRKDSYQARKAETQTDAQKYRESNREKAKQTLAENPKNRTFVGMCLRHGETDFYVKIEKRIPSGISYACKACKNNVKI